MFVVFLCFSIALSTALSAVTKDVTNSCSLNEYSCSDGACVSSELICNGDHDCADGSDEMGCGYSQLSLPYGETILNRSRRQLAKCRKNQWQCRDGMCIQFDGKCDGVVDCRDGSDETHALCWKNQCQSNWFRCTYGACVDGTAPCNNVKECADNSDELLPRCRNETVEIRGQFKCKDGTNIPASNHCDGVKDCPDGSDETIMTCAGKTCPSYLFQCAYGACVDSGANCNKIQECADNSDEAEALCGTSANVVTIRPTSGNCILPPYPEHGTYSTNIAGATPGNSFQYVTVNVTCYRGYGVNGPMRIHCQDGQWEYELPKCERQCRLDPHPSVEYVCIVTGEIKGSRPCNSYEPVGTLVQPVCQAHYYPTTLSYMKCIDGYWNYVARCKPGLVKIGTNITILIKEQVEVHRSEFTYVVPFDDKSNSSGTEYQGNFDGGSHEADKSNSSGIEYHHGNIDGGSYHNADIYNYSGTEYLGSNIVYHNGQFNPISDSNTGSNDESDVNKLKSSHSDKDIRMECGTVTPEGIELVFGGVSAKTGELPWHAGIYSKAFNPYMQVCGGSLISNKVIISAAHCFWTDLQKQLPASQFAVAVGKIYRPWNDQHDDAQKSDVKEIHIPIRFQGASSNFQDDIALVIVVDAFEYKNFIRPVCISFDVIFERQQLQTNNNGTVAGWGLTSANGKASPVLQVIRLPYVEVAACYDNSPPSFRPFITSDKICAGSNDGSTALCKGDSGGGLAFPTSELAVQRYYLRGIVSTAPNNENVCNLATYTSFTQIMNHEQFIKQFWTDSY